MKLMNNIIYLLLFIYCYQIEWDEESLWNITYINYTQSQSSFNYYLMDPDNLLTAKEYNQTIQQLNTFYKKNLVNPFLFFVKNIKSSNDKEVFANKMLELIEEKIKILLLDNHKDHQNFLLILVSKNDNVLSFRIGFSALSRITSQKLDKIKKNSKSYFEYDNRKLLYNIISDFNCFLDNEYDYMDREKIDDYENPFDFDYEDKDEEIDPWDEKPKGPVTPYQPKKEKKDENKDKNKDKDKNNDDNIINKKKDEKSSFYEVFFIILILIILCFTVLFYFLGKKMKILKIQNINYEKLIGTELEQA